MKISRVRRVRSLRSASADVSSFSEITEPTEEKRKRTMNWFVSEGSTLRIAGLSTMKRKVCVYLRPSAPAASSWPLGTESMPPRKISAV